MKTEKPGAEATNDYTPPAGAQSVHTSTLNGTQFSYAVDAGWIVLRKDDKPAAELFHVYYRQAADDDADSRRPITFLFNGGPGAASAYLHVGAVGPRRVTFNPDGTVPPAPVQLVDNADSWIAFTDLVFVDPVGTGFSREVPDTSPKPEGGSDEPAPSEYWKIQRDLDSLGEFVTRFLSIHHRWDSPVYLAGESYGGFRAAKLSRLLPEKYGVGLNGSILISPALDFTVLTSSDYDVLPWVDLLPSLAGAALHHGLGGPASNKTGLEDTLSLAEKFARTDLPRLLIGGTDLAQADRAAILNEIAGLTSLPVESVESTMGRISNQRFCRELLQERHLICGLYDASVTTRDPYPDRPTYEGPDPTLRSIERLFASGINALIRREFKVDTDREYHLLSMEVNEGWQNDVEKSGLTSQIQAMDDLRYATSLNPHLKVRISHGIYDLVTPYFTSNRLVAQQAGHIPDAAISLLHYTGGHMFYAWEESRARFTDDIKTFYSKS